jgi:hypothetical protein
LETRVTPSLALSPASLPADTVGINYQQTVTASGGVGTTTVGDTITAGTIPAGLTFTTNPGNPATLVISGTPSSSGTVKFSVTATDTVGATLAHNYTLTINPAVKLSPPTLPATTVGIAYSGKIMAAGGTGNKTFSYQVTSGTIPAGLTFTAGTNQLAVSGTPTAGGSVTFTATATDSVGGTASQSYTLTINPPPAITNSALSNWTVNFGGYSQKITTSGGTAPFTFSVSSGALPTGLTLGKSTGALTGKPTVAGQYSFTVTAVDHVGATCQAAFTVTINPLLAITTTTLPIGVATQASYAALLATAGGTGPFIFKIKSGALPPGLSLSSSSGAITGTPSTKGTYPFTVSATDKSKDTATVSLAITIDPVGVIVPAYFYPGTGGPGGSGDGWAALAAAAGQVAVTAIFNPDSGPAPGPADPNYVTALTNLENAGGRVIAYVWTNYAGVPLATVEGEINTYLSQYGSLIQGFFLDGMANDNSTGDVSYYHSLYAYVKGLNPAYLVVGNPGTSTVPDYLTAATQGADVVVTFENPAANYAGNPPPSWVSGYAPSHFGNVLYAEPTVAGMNADVALAGQRNVGYVYLTDQTLNPPTGYLYDQLPSYWDQEVTSLASLL